MNKYFKKLNPKDLVGQSFSAEGDFTENANTYKILSADFNKEGELNILILNETDTFHHVQKSGGTAEQHLEAYNELKEMLNKYTVSEIEHSLDSVGNVYMLAYSIITLNNPLMRYDFEENSYDSDIKYFYVNSEHDYPLDDYFSTPTWYKFVSNKGSLSVKECYKQEPNIIRELRKIFAKIFGKEYTEEIKKYYYCVIKEIFSEELAEHEEEQRKLKKLLNDNEKEANNNENDL